MHENTFFKAPRYLMRKHNILNMVSKISSVKSFIDVGCGAGELTCSLVERNLEGVGLDFSENAINTAKSIKKKRGLSDRQVSFKKGELGSLKERYDLAIACEVLEHVEDDLDLLKQISKVSKRYVLVSVPAKMKYYDEFDRKVGHFRRYEKDELIALFDKAGLDIEDFRSYGFPLINFTRLIRKAGAKFVKKQKNMTESTKQSGINPIKLPRYITRIDMELITKPFYWVSLPFNRFNFSEGYLVLGKKRQKS